MTPLFGEPHRSLDERVLPPEGTSVVQPVAWSLPPLDLIPELATRAPTFDSLPGRR
ncbi:MAG: hypothetical protein IT383_06430 [Deltaproteobacteria bacterium]|nr:hypothetical protein [Deltaproteobacteria bacterium]